MMQDNKNSGVPEQKKCPMKLDVSNVTLFLLVN